jgi:hypothetical protein
MSARKVSNPAKASVATGSAGMAGAVATWAAVKYGVPLELTIPVVGALLGWVGKWAGKLDPDR